MPIFKNAVPASLRVPLDASRFESSRFAHNLMGRAQKQTLIAGPEARAAALSKSRFARLPHEPEDARMTGVTRSLNRRLLALNISGSRTGGTMLIRTRIA